MSEATLTAILHQAATAPNYVPPVSMYRLGRRAYQAGKPFEACITDEMRAGWLAAERAGAWAYWQAMSAEGLQSLALEVAA